MNMSSLGCCSLSLHTFTSPATPLRDSILNRERFLQCSYLCAGVEVTKICSIVQRVTASFVKGSGFRKLQICAPMQFKTGKKREALHCPCSGDGGPSPQLSWVDSAPSEKYTSTAVDLQRAGSLVYCNIPSAVVELSRKRSMPFTLPAAEEECTQTGQLDTVHADLASHKSLVWPGASNKASKQLCVAVDVDEVLGSFLASLNVFIAEKYFLHHDISEYHTYDFRKIWNCSQAEANHRVHAFFDSEHFNNGIFPIPGAYQTLLQLASHCDLVVVTSRQHVIQKPTLEWIERHYEGIFKEVHFGNHFALEGSSRPKSEICRCLGAHILIDDNPKYAIDCAESGIEVLLFDLYGSYPWSKTPEGPCHPLIKRVRDWQEVEQVLLARTWASL